MRMRWLSLPPHTVLGLPALSPTMTSGNISKYLVKEGDKVSSGDVIAEIETDKATMEVEAVDEGVVGKILVAEAKGVDATTEAARRIFGAMSEGTTHRQTI